MTTWGGTTKLTPFAKIDNNRKTRIQAFNATPGNNLIDNFLFMAPPAPDCTCVNPEKHKV
jgi:hypothetical protein